MSFIHIEVTDELSPAIEYAIAHNAKYKRHVLKAIGYEMRKRIKEGVKSGAPNGCQFKEKFPYEYRKALQGGYATMPHNWYGKMKNALRYEYADGGVNLGWGSRTSATYGRKQEEGFKITVTPRVMQKFREAKVPLGEHTKFLHVPPRPFWEPMIQELKPEIVPFIEKRIQEYINGTVEIGKRRRRRYRV